MENQATEKQIWKMKDLGITVPEGCTKKQAFELINEKMGGSKPSYPKEVTPKKSDSQATFYVKYATDLCVQLINSGYVDKETNHDLKTVMLECIDVVKCAKNAFENGY